MSTDIDIDRRVELLELTPAGKAAMASGEAFSGTDLAEFARATKEKDWIGPTGRGAYYYMSKNNTKVYAPKGFRPPKKSEAPKGESLAGAPILKGWLGGLSDDAREQVFAAMREVRAKSDRALADYQKAAPRGGQLNVGSGHFDAFLKGEALAGFLSALSKGQSPQEAAETAKSYAREMIGKWNKAPQGVSINGPHELHRWEGGADTDIETAMRRVIQASPQAPAVQPLSDSGRQEMAMLAARKANEHLRVAHIDHRPAVSAGDIELTRLHADALKSLSQGVPLEQAVSELHAAWQRHPAGVAEPARSQATADAVRAAHAHARSAPEYVPSGDGPPAPGDEITYEPHDKKFDSPVRGHVREVIQGHGGDVGYHVLAPTDYAPDRVARVWESRGKVAKTGRSLAPSPGAKKMSPPSEASAAGGDVRPYRSAADLAAEYRAQGLDRDRAWGQFVKDTILMPRYRSEQVNARDFFRNFDGK